MQARRNYSAWFGLAWLCAGLAIAVLPAHETRARQLADGACPLLADAIAQSIQRVLEPGSRQATIPVPNSADAYTVAGCALTAATASRAFGEAVRATGVEVSWHGSDPLDPGDYCLSHFLDQCYPRSRPGIFAQSSIHDAWIAVAWDTVVAGLKQGMPFGAASDFVYFRPAPLADRLALSLGITLGVVRSGAGSGTAAASAGGPLPVLR